MTQNASEKTYIDTKQKKDQTKIQKNIDQNTQTSTHTSEIITQITKEAEKAQQSFQEHESVANEQVVIINQLKNQLETVTETAAKKVVSDPADAETIKTVTEKITEATKVSEEEKALGAAAKAKATTLDVKIITDKKTIKDLEGKKKNLEAKKESIDKKVEILTKVKGKGKKHATEVKKKNTQAKEKQTETTKVLEEIVAEKTLITTKIEELTTTDASLKKQQKTIEAEIKAINENIATNATQTPEDITENQNKVAELESEIKTTKEEIIKNQVEKQDETDKVTNIEVQEKEQQKKVEVISEEVKKTGAQTAQIITAISNDNTKVIKKKLELITTIDEEILEDTKEIVVLKEKIAISDFEKDQSQKNLQSDQSEIEKTTKIIELSTKDGQFSMCQALFYSIPETQRQQFFSSPAPSSSQKCSGDQVYNQIYKVRFEGDRKKLVLFAKKLGSFSKSGEFTNFVLSTGIFDWNKGKGDRLYKTLNKKRAILDITVGDSSLSLCEIEELVQNKFGSLISSAKVSVYSLHKLQKSGEE